MTDPSAPAARPLVRSRWVLIMLIGAVLLVAALVVSRQMAARTAATEAAPASADCAEEPPPSSFTLPECDAEGAPAEKPETSSPPN